MIKKRHFFDRIKKILKSICVNRKILQPLTYQNCKTIKKVVKKDNIYDWFVFDTMDDLTFKKNGVNEIWFYFEDKYDVICFPFKTMTILNNNLFLN